MKKIILSFIIIINVLLVNAQSWSELGSLNGLSANAGIKRICSDPLGDIYAGGYFTNASGNRYVAKWNGMTWSEIGGGERFIGKWCYCKYL